MSEEIKDQTMEETNEAEQAEEETGLLLDEESSLDAEEEDEDLIVYDADAEDEMEAAALRAKEASAAAASGADFSAAADVDEPHNVRSMAEMMAIIEALIFVSEEPLSTKALADVLKEDRGWIETALEGLAEEFNARNGGLHLREVAGGWQFATRPEHHEHVRAFLKSRPSAKLSLASLETLAVIAYKQPITVPEILEIRGVQSPSAIKTLLDKRLIKACGRKETIGRPMMYGTSKEFLLQFGLKDLSELPSIEDFEDLAGGA
jgi:segregation and condensation protein B